MQRDVFNRFERQKFIQSDEHKSYTIRPLVALVCVCMWSSVLQHSFLHSNLKSYCQVIYWGIYMRYILIVIFSIVDLNPDVAMDAIVHITQQITSTNRYELSRVLRALNAQCDDEKEITEENNCVNRPARTLSLPCTLSGMGGEQGN